MFRYVDDFVVLVQGCNFHQNVLDIVQVFRNCGLGLEFPYELPQDKQLQFLDVKLELKLDHVCWMYSPGSEKPLLNFNPGHSKVIKNGIAFSCLRSALFEFCGDQIGTSFFIQLVRLKDAGFMNGLSRLTVQKLIKRVKMGTGALLDNRVHEQIRPAMLPCVHRISHGSKNVADRFTVKEVFSAPHKLSKIGEIVDRKLKEGLSRAVRKGCGVKDLSPFVPFKTCVVYLIPFTCGHVYIWKTSRCVNIRLLEHKRSLQENTSSHVDQHCSQCGCVPVFHDTEVLSVHRDQITREIIQAYNIRRSGERCISVLSIH